MELPFPVASSGGLLLRGPSSGMPDQRQMLGFFHVPMSWRSRLKLQYAGAALKGSVSFFRHQEPGWPEKMTALIKGGKERPGRPDLLMGYSARTVPPHRQQYPVYTSLLVIMITCTVLAGYATAQTPGKINTPLPQQGKNAAIDPGAPPKTRIPLTPTLSAGGRLKFEYTLEKNFDLNQATADDRNILNPELSIAFFYKPSQNIHMFLNLGLGEEIKFQEGGNTTDVSAQLLISQAYLSMKKEMPGNLFSLFQQPDREGDTSILALQIGRQRLKDEREWLFDEEMDAVRFSWGVRNALFELSAIRKGLFDGDLLGKEEDERIHNYHLVYKRYALERRITMAAYGLIRDNKMPGGRNPLFLGLHSSGEVLNDLDYWLEIARESGKDGSMKIRGIGLDLGSSYQFDYPLKPSIALGFAFGSGDADPNDSIDRRFRQSGLEDNQGKFHGVTGFKYYGELTDPELSNLLIFTGGLGIRPTRRSSIDLVFHEYLQDKVSTKLKGWDIDAKPAGLSRRLGREIDLITGYREIRDLDAKLILGYFIAEDAFPQDAQQNSFLVNAEIRWSF